MKKHQLIVIVVWGNIIGFLAMRFLGKVYDYTPSFKQSEIDLYFGIALLYIILGAPGAYFYAEDIKASGEDLNVFHLIWKVFETGFFAFLLGSPMIILGRVL